MRTGASRSWTGFVVVLIGGFVVAFLFGRTATPVAYDPMGAGDGAGSPTATPRARGAAPATGAVDEGDGELAERAAEIEREIESYDQLAQAYEEELYGIPPTWPEEVPELVSPEGFEAQVRRAVEECGAGVDVTGFDCSEPPCFALLRVRDENWHQQLINECPAWFEPYGKMTSGASFSVECADGSVEQVEMLSVPLTKVIGDAEQTRGNGMKRLLARKSVQELRWTCAAGGE